MTKHLIKIKFLFITIFLLCGSLLLFGQRDVSQKEINYKWCIEWLEEMRPAIIADTLGKYGAKWSAAERLLKEGCNFENELFPIVENYFGEPDEKLNYSNNEYIKHKSFSMKYLLFKPPGTSTTGMKWLIIDCDNNYRITKFWIFTVDE